MADMSDDFAQVKKPRYSEQKIAKKRYTFIVARVSRGPPPPYSAKPLLHVLVLSGISSGVKTMLGRGQAAGLGTHNATKRCPSATFILGVEGLQ